MERKGKKEKRGKEVWQNDVTGAQRAAKRRAWVDINVTDRFTALCCILLLSMLNMRLLMQYSWNVSGCEKILEDCVSQQKITNTVKTCSSCPCVSLCGCQVLACGLEMSTDLLLPWMNVGLLSPSRSMNLWNWFPPQVLAPTVYSNFWRLHVALWEEKCSDLLISYWKSDMDLDEGCQTLW